MSNMRWTIGDLTEDSVERLRVMRHWREVSLHSNQMNLAAGVETYPSGLSVQGAIRHDQDIIAAIDEELARRKDKQQ